MFFHVASLHKYISTCFLIPAASLVVSLPAWADFSSVFTAPPYALDQTIIGIEDWEMVNKEPYPVYTDPMMAVLVESPFFNSSQPTTLSLKTLIKNMLLRPEELGDHFVMETQFAVSFTPNYDRWGGLYFRLGANPASSPFVFGYDHDKEGDGGFYFQGAEGRVVFLQRAEIQENSLYKFVVRVDMGGGTFSIQVTNADNPSFHYEKKDIAFQEEYVPKPYNTSGLFMGNNKPSFMEAFINSIKVTSE